MTEEEGSTGQGLQQNEDQSASCAQSTNKRVNYHSKDATQTQHQRPQSPTVWPSPSIRVSTRDINSTRRYLCEVYVPLVEFMHLVFTYTPCESYRRRLRSLLLCLCVTSFELQLTPFRRLDSTGWRTVYRFFWVSICTVSSVPAWPLCKARVKLVAHVKDFISTFDQ